MNFQLKQNSINGINLNTFLSSGAIAFIRPEEKQGEQMDLNDLQRSPEAEVS